MKINSAKIKNWSPSERLREMGERIEGVLENLDREDSDPEEALKQVLQIVRGWKRELGTEEEKPVKKKSGKPMNLWP